MIVIYEVYRSGLAYSWAANTRNFDFNLWYVSQMRPSECVWMVPNTIDEDGNSILWNLLEA